jgi:hypothetical protein
MDFTLLCKHRLYYNKWYPGVYPAAAYRAHLRSSCEHPFLACSSSRQSSTGGRRCRGVSRGTHLNGLSRYARPAFPYRVPRPLEARNAHTQSTHTTRLCGTLTSCCPFRRRTMPRISSVSQLRLSSRCVWNYDHHTVAAWRGVREAGFLERP